MQAGAALGGQPYPFSPLFLEKAAAKFSKKKLKQRLRGNAM